MRIGLFGGTFDPIHFGHLSAARDVRDGFFLDKIYIIPSATPPHKDSAGMTSAACRYQMACLAVKEYEGLTDTVAVSDVELKRSGPSYTIDTVTYFKAIMPPDTLFYLILGIDAFREIDTWKSYTELFNIIPFIVMTRPGKGQRIDKLIRYKVSDKYQFMEKQSGFFHKNKKAVFFFYVTPVDISSTIIRKFVKQGKNIGSLVPGKVNDFIHNRGLYL